MKPYEYITREPTSSSAVTEWTFETYNACETHVAPDGCRDIIVQECQGEDASWFISSLSSSSYMVPTASGMSIRGLRLKPGVEILHSELSSWLQSRHPAAVFYADQLSEFCIVKENVDNALQCISSDKQTVLCAAKELGVSLRTLERLVKSGTGQSPSFWFALARARRAGRALFECDSLSLVASDSGFADQAHMTREMKKWFGRTPKQIKTDGDMHLLLSERGYG